MERSGLLVFGVHLDPFNWTEAERGDLRRFERASRFLRHRSSFRSCWSDGRVWCFPEPFADLSKLLAMARAGETRIQLCGRFVVRLDGSRVEDVLAGAKGQLLFAYLVLNRLRRIDRDELLSAVYGDDATPDHNPRLSVLLSKLRRVVGPEHLPGRAQIELVLPPDAFVDVEAALDGLHRAESHIAAGEWTDAWGPAGIAYHVASRPLLQGHDRPWLDEWRRRLDDVRLRGLECFAAARLGLGGPTLPQAEQCGRQLIALAPYRESGYRILMEALELRGNVAEALLVYDRLRVLLRDELGIAPSPAVQTVYRRLLGEAATTTV
jgi:SARP family transcriptional regulator, regulator of embCAB operon